MQGLLTNRLMEQGSQDALPAIGDGATIVCYTDRRPATVIAIEGTAKRPVVVIQEDRVVRFAEDRHYAAELARNPEGAVSRVQLRTRKGVRRWMAGCNVVRFGERSYYYDLEF